MSLADSKRRGRTLMRRLRSALDATRRPDTSPIPLGADALVFCHDNDRGATVDGLPFAQLADAAAELMRQAGLRVTTVAHFPSSLTEARAFGNPAALNRKLALAHVLDAGANLVWSRKLGRTHARSARTTYVTRALERWISASGARLVLAIETPAGLAAACHSLNVPVFELIHGYGYHKIPWGYDRRERLELPDGVLVFDSVTRTTFDGLAGGTLCNTIVKNPWYELLSTNGDFLTRVDGASELHEKLQSEKGSRPRTVLVSLQWGLERDPVNVKHVPNAILPSGLEDAIRDTKDEVFWIVRLHPVQLRQPRYRSHVDFVRRMSAELGNVADLETAKLPLPLLLRHCDGHITFSSMVTYEAAVAGVPSLVLNPRLLQARTDPKAFMHDLAASGWAQMSVPDRRSITNWLHALEPHSSSSRSGDVHSPPASGISLADWASATLSAHPKAEWNTGSGGA